MALSDDFKLLHPIEDLFREAIDYGGSPRGGRNYRPVESGPPSEFAPQVSLPRRRRKAGKVDEDALRKVMQEMDKLIGLSH